MFKLVQKFIFVLLVPAIFALAQPTAEIAGVDVYGAFETAGVNIRLTNYDHNETAQIFYKKTGQPASSFRQGHPFVRYDANHLATSLFNLKPGTSYDLKVELTDPDGANANQTVETTVSTRPEFYIPAALRKVTVANSSELKAAIKQVQPGDHILLNPGAYEEKILISAKNGTAENPIVLMSSDTSHMAYINNRLVIQKSSWIYLDHLEIHDSRSGQFGGIYIRASHHTAITHCYVHDCGDNSSANITIQHSEEISGEYNRSGHHLIMNNIISDEDPLPPSDRPYDYQPNITYYGIKFDHHPGAFTIIRGNTIYGVIDGIAPGGDEGQNPVLGLDDPDVLDTWENQNLDIYDNVIYAVADDCIETDGHTMNGRIFRNRLGTCQNAISTAPVYPGPLFIVRNTMHGFRENAAKMNTGVKGETRNILWLNNTIKQADYASKCIYRGEPAKTQRITFKNNILMARSRIIDSDIYGANIYHRLHVFDYDLMYTTGDAPIFKWAEEGDDIHRYNTLADFQSGTERDYGFRQEAHGIYAEARLDLTPLDGIPAEEGILDFRLLDGSPGIDQALIIPGITDYWVDAGPDMGAFEYGMAAFVDEQRVLPGDFVLHQNYPNPFNPMTTIYYDISRPAKVTLAIYNMMGQKVNLLVHVEQQESGGHSVVWDGTDAAGQRAGSGVYFYRLYIDQQQAMVRKMILLK